MRIRQQRILIALLLLAVAILIGRLLLNQSATGATSLSAAPLASTGHRKYPGIVLPDARWLAIQRSPDLAAEIHPLINGHDPEGIMLAVSAIHICQHAGVASSTNDTAGIDFEQTLVATNRGTGSDDARHARKLIDDTFKRCGHWAAPYPPLRAAMARANALAKSQGGRLAIASAVSSKALTCGVNAAERKVIDDILRDQNFASIWLPEQADLLMKVAVRDGYAKDLSIRQTQAMVWLTICDLGADCADQGFGRLMACFQSGICAGESVAEGIAESESLKNLSVLRAHANGFGQRLAVEGVDAFKFPQK